MANLYPYFDNGTLENYNSGIWSTLNVEPAAGSDTVSKSDVMAFEGTKSLRIKYGTAGGKYDQQYGLYIGFRSGFSPIVLTPGKRYIAKVRVNTPAAEPGLIGSDGVPIILDSNMPFAGKTIVNTVTDATHITITLSDGAIIKYTNVGKLKTAGTWLELSHEFTEPATGSAGFRYIFGLRFTTETAPGVPYWAAPAGADIFNSGALYFDKITLEEVGACDLALGSPAYTKTDETGVGANNGTITLNATSSYTRQYSLDNATWQSSNVFTGKAPGVYTGYIRDTNPNVCSLVVNNIVILEFDAPDPPPPVVPAVLSIDDAPINSYNFVSWFNAIGDTAFNGMTFTNCFNGFAKPYRLRNIYSKRHYPVIVNNEQFSFYLNFDTNFNNPNFASFRLNLIKHTGNVQSDIAPLLKVTQDDGVNYYIYSSVTLAGVSPGIYRFAIVDTSDTNRILYVSQEIQVMTSENAAKYTTRLQFRNSASIYKYLYEKIATFYQELRLRLTVIGEGTDGDLEQYRAVSTGELRNVNVELDLVRTFESYYFDDLANNAMFVFQICDKIYLNGKLHVVKSLFKPDEKADRYLCKGKIEFYDQAFSTANRYGSESDAIAAEEGPFLLGDGGSRIKL
jgi:hypothetical protein